MSDHTTKSKDLTRWNRAGLSRFRYINGNAPVWQEALRSSLAERFPDWDKVQVDASREASVEILEQQYQGARGDLLWETTRAFSRACHVLTEYVDHYANEGYIGTTTQWENLRRLVEMIDYHPASPASASTWLVLLAKEEKSGTVDTGFKVKYSPEDGGNSVVFETLEDIDVSETLNELHLQNWDQGEGTLEDAVDDGIQLWVADEDMTGLFQGQIAVVEGDSEAVADSIDTIDDDSGVIELSGTAWQSYDIASATLHLKPKSIYKPYLNGERVVEFETEHGLSVGDLVGWNTSGSTWIFSSVEAVDTRRVRLSSSTLPSNKDVYRALEITSPTGGSDFMIPGSYKKAVYYDEASADFVSITSGDYQHISKNLDVDNDGDTSDDNISVSYRRVTNDSVSTIYIVNDDAIPLGTATTLDSETLVFAGGYGDLNGGDWVAIEEDNGTRTALQIATISEFEDSFSIEFEGDFSFSDVQIERLYGPFKYHLQAQGSDTNQSVLDSMSELQFSLTELPAEIGVGRKLIIAQDDGEGNHSNQVAATVLTVNRDNVSVTITPELESNAGFTKGNTVIHANVVNAGHGERQPDRVLGSGEATQSNQSFEFKNAEVSFVADSSMDTGVRADIDITVDNQTWEQVSTLNDSGPTDIHYSVRMTEEGYLKIIFGDGEHGRRLPSGSNNIRIAWRKGTGLGGNLNPDSLIKPVKPHYLLDKVKQPLEASGGGDMESVDSLRETAPASVLTLKRAVSVTDFKNLTAAHSSVWQANAFSVADKQVRGEKVEVVVVPAGGVSLSSDLKKTLTEYLQTYSLPGVVVDVTEYDPIVITLDITVRVKSDEYDPETVKADVKAALLERFKLENRKLGTDLFRAELYEVAEGIEGVENSECKIDTMTGTPEDVMSGDTGVVRMISVGERQVVYVSGDGLGITVQHDEYSL